MTSTLEWLSLRNWTNHMLWNFNEVNAPWQRSPCNSGTNQYPSSTWTLNCHHQLSHDNPQNTQNKPTNILFRTTASPAVTVVRCQQHATWSGRQNRHTLPKKFRSDPSLRVPCVLVWQLQIQIPSIIYQSPITIAFFNQFHPHHLNSLLPSLPSFEKQHIDMTDTLTSSNIYFTISICQNMCLFSNVKFSFSESFKMLICFQGYINNLC